MLNITDWGGVQVEGGAFRGREFLEWGENYTEFSSTGRGERKSLRGETSQKVEKA